MKDEAWLGLAMLTAALLKGLLVVSDRVPFNADEAIIALMGRHILQGARPIFFYGQAYMGSLDAYLVAGGFYLFGEQVWVIRLIQTGLYLGVLWTTYLLGKRVFASSKTGVIAAWLLAVPTVNVVLYTTASLGGYGEALLLGNLILLVSLKIGVSDQSGDRKRDWQLWGILGLLIGLGLWGFGLTLVYSIPAVLYVISVIGKRSRILSVSIFIGAFFLGSSAWWIFAAQNGLAQLLGELSGGAIAGVEQLNWFGQILQHGYSLLLLGSTVIFGMRPPWNAEWLVLPLLPFALIFWLLVLLWMGKSLAIRDSNRPARLLLVGTAITLLVGFLLTPFGADPSGRYFVPLIIPLSLFAANLIDLLFQKNLKSGWLVLLFVLVYQGAGIVQTSLRFPPGITTQFYAPTQIDQRGIGDLIQFLREKGESHGYTNYWVSYPLAFLSQEELVFIPRLPYHQDFRYTQRDDRYPPYDALVFHADRVAYITTNHPDLDERLRNYFLSQEISWEEQKIGDFQVFYQLSRVVKPEELGL